MPDKTIETYNDIASQYDGFVTDFWRDFPKSVFNTFEENLFFNLNWISDFVNTMVAT